jgi:hypothetical protein
MVVLLFSCVKLKPHISFIMKNNSIFAQFSQPRHSQGTAKAQPRLLNLLTGSIIYGNHFAWV